MEKTDQSYEVTGELIPDVTGTFEPIGLYNDKPSYVNAAGSWLIWWDGIDTWYISTLRGTPGGAHWTRTDPAIQGIYSEGGTAGGDATVTVI